MRGWGRALGTQHGDQGWGAPSTQPDMNWAHPDRDRYVTFWLFHTPTSCAPVAPGTHRGQVRGPGTHGDTPHPAPWQDPLGSPPKPHGHVPVPAAGAVPASPGPVTTPQEGAEVGLFLVASSAELLPRTGLPEQLGHMRWHHQGHFSERAQVLESPGPGHLAPRWCESASSARAACCRGRAAAGKGTAKG